MGLETSTWRRETTATVGGNIRSHFGSRPSNHTFLRLSVLHCLSISRLGSAMSALTDFFSSLRKVATDHDLTDIISDLAYHGGSPMQVREYMISCCANEASKDITKDLLVMAIVTLQFGTKPISDGLQANKSSKYHNTAKQLMSWAKEKFSQYKENNLVPGLTANSLAAAVPELCVMYAGLSGSANRPIPGLLQLPLSEEMRGRLEEHVASRVNPKGTSTEAGRIAAALQRSQPMTRFHCGSDSSGAADENSPIYDAFNTIRGYLTDCEIVGSDFGACLEEVVKDVSAFALTHAGLNSPAQSATPATAESAKAAPPAKAATASRASPTPGEAAKILTGKSRRG